MDIQVTQADVQAVMSENQSVALMVQVKALTRCVEQLTAENARLLAEIDYRDKQEYDSQSDQEAKK